MNDPRFEVFPHRRDLTDAEVKELLDAEAEVPTSTPTGEFGWRLRAGNGRIVATSGEGFTREADAVRAIGDALGAGLAACGLAGHLTGLADGRVTINVLNTDDEPQSVSVSYVRE